MDIKILDGNSQDNLTENGQIKSQPIILDVQFNPGKFSVVIMRPDGLGTAYYNGYAHAGSPTIHRTWTLPIRGLDGTWRIVVVCNRFDEQVDHKTIEAEMHQSELGQIKKATSQTITPRINVHWPKRDITIPYPTLWIRGEAQNTLNFLINEKTYSVTPFDGFFLFPVQMKSGSYDFLNIKEETTGYKSSLSVLTIDGSSLFAKTPDPPANLNQSIILPNSSRNYNLLSVYDPIKGNSTTESNCTLTGIVFPGATLTINDEDVPVSDGKFEYNKDLIDGLNPITFVATAGEETQTVSMTIQKEWNKAVYGWTLPSEDHVTKRKYLICRGWAHPESIVEINGTEIDLNPTDDPFISTFETVLPVKLGVNEIELKVTDKDDNVSRETRWIESDYSKASIKVLTGLDELFTMDRVVNGQVTPGYKVKYQDIDFPVDLDGLFEIPVDVLFKMKEDESFVQPSSSPESSIPVDKIIEAQITAEIDPEFTDNYDTQRTSDMRLNEIRYLDDFLRGYCQNENIETINDLFNKTDDFLNSDLPEDVKLHTQQLLGFLLIGTKGLALFTQEEAYLLSLSMSINSIEDIVTTVPEEIVSELKEVAEMNGLEPITVFDIIRFQKTLDDLLFEFQESYLG